MPIAFKCAGALLTLAVVSVRASTVPQDSHAVPSPQTLSERVPIEATIKAGASHQYRMNLRSQQFVRFLITQRGIELTLKLIAPSGKIVADRAGSTGAYEPQRLLLVTEEVGSYTLALRPQPGQSTGRYEVALAETRESQPADGNLSEADTLVSRGNELFNKDTQTSLGEAIDLYQKALALWRIAGDREAETRTLLQIGRAFTSRHDVEPATHYLDEALDASAAAGDRVLEAAAQMTFSDLYLGMSDAAKGLERGQRALELRADAKTTTH